MADNEAIYDSVLGQMFQTEESHQQPLLKARSLNFTLEFDREVKDL